MQSNYEILGIKEGASKKEVQQAFKEQAKKCHPDHDKSPGAHERFLKVHKAYKSILSGKDQPQAATQPTRTTKKAYMMGSNMVVTLRITIHELLSAATKSFIIKKKIPCPSCAGTGSEKKKTKTCPYCNGTGLKGFYLALGSKKRCDYCEGAGVTPMAPPCHECNGRGIVLANKTHKLKLDPFSSEMMTLVGEGNHIYGGHPGDLHIDLDVENDTPFTLNGLDVGGVVNISAAQAILGDTLKLSVLGKPLTLMIPPGVQNRQIVSQPWAGVKVGNTTGTFKAEIKIKIPLTVPAEEAVLYGKIRSLEKGRKWPKTILTS